MWPVTDKWIHCFYIARLLLLTETTLAYKMRSSFHTRHFLLHEGRGQFLGFVSCIMTRTCRLSWFLLCCQILTHRLSLSSMCAHVCWVTMLTTSQVWVWFPQWLHLHSPAVYNLWFPLHSSLDCWTALTDFVLMWQPGWPNLAHEEKLTWIQTC